MIDEAKMERIRRLIQSNGIKGEFAKTAKRILRETEGYSQARAEGRARQWLNDEASSFAESAYEILLQRAEEFGGVVDP